MLKAVFFDFDGTLSDDGATIDQALDRASAVVCDRWPEINASALESTYRKISDRAWSDYDRYLRPLASPEAMLTALWKHTLEHFGYHDTAVEQAAADTYWQLRLQNCKLYTDVLPLLAELRQTIHLSLLTNGAPSMQRAKVQAAGIDSFFQHIFVGGEFAQGKPAALIFTAALQAAVCRPEEAVHIGDSLWHDVAGAQKSGIHTVWLNRKGQRRQDHAQDQAQDLAQDTPNNFPQPDFEIVSLKDLPACLDHLQR